MIADGNNAKLSTLYIAQIKIGGEEFSSTPYRVFL